MFAQSLNTYATPVPTVFNSTLSSAFENAKFTLTNGPNDLLTLLGNKATVTADANITLVQNRDCTALIPNTANRTITLPPLEGQAFPILIEKTSNNFFTITVNRNGAPDTIENPYGVTAVAINTSLTLHLPGEAYLFIPSGTYWRVVTLNLPVNQCFANVWQNGNQSLTDTGFQKMRFNTEIDDIGSNFDNVTNFRFTVPFDMQINIVGNALVNSGSSSYATSAIYKNGTEFRRGFGGQTTTAALELGVAMFDRADAGDYYELFFFNSGATRTSVGQIQHQTATFQMVSKL